MSETKFTEDKIDSFFTNLSKTGPTTRSKNLLKLEPIAREVQSQFDGEELLYDAVFDGPPQSTHMTFTELLSSAIYLNVCSSVVRERQIADAALEEATYDVCARVLSENANKDKYNLIRNPLCKKCDSVIMLPGSNLYAEAVDEEKIERILSTENAVIKPHPITNQEIISKLNRKFGNKVLKPHTSGMDVLVKADKVYTTGASETSLYAVMMGKEIGSIEKDDSIQRGAYRQLFDTLMASDDKYRTLNNILGSFKSGIFFVWDYQEKIEKYFEYIKETVEEMKKDGN